MHGTADRASHPLYLLNQSFGLCDYTMYCMCYQPYGTVNYSDKSMVLNFPKTPVLGACTVHYRPKLRSVVKFQVETLIPLVVL